MPAVLAFDQGTTSTRAIIFSENGEKLGVHQIALAQHFPRPGWVEHDATRIWDDQLACARGALEAADLEAADLTAVAITNQRETAVMWDRATGQPIHRAIVWQDRRTAAACEDLAARPGVAELVRDRTGLGIDPYFSASKIAWLLEHVDGARARAQAGELAFGTIDTWLIWNLTGGAVHATDTTNASRTLLYNIDTAQWDPELCALWGIPEELLPVVCRSSEVVGHADSSVLGAPLPIAGVCGDQQAALVGNGGLHAGAAKATFGTGVFALMHTGSERPHSETLAVTLAAQIGDEVEYALEGSVFMGGAIVQWLVEEMHIADSPSGIQQLAETVEDSNGVILVPALTGLGAPHWDPYARGALFGLTRGASSAHLARAALESIALQVGDLVGAMISDSGHSLDHIRADGGVSVNQLVMQSLADVLGVRVDCASMPESTALGAAFLAGLATGVWSGSDDLPVLTGLAASFEPDPQAAESMARLKQRWAEAVRRSLKWEDA